MQLNEDGRLTLEQIDYFAGLLGKYQSTYSYLKDYYLGYNPGITRPPHIDDPDNRIPVPIARKIISTVKGYAYRPGYISYDTGDSTFFEDTIKPVFDENDEELLTSELASDVMAFGVAFEILRMGENGKDVKQYRIPVNTGWPIYGDTLDKPLIAFIHDVIIDHIVGDPITEMRTIYYADAYEVYTSKEGSTWELVETKPHPFESVPVIVYKGNDPEIPIFKPVIPMIDELDKVISSNADERERFANAFLLTLFNLDDTIEDDNEETDVDRIMRSRIMQDLGRSGDIKSVRDAVDYLSKPSRGTEVSEDADRLERLIYDQTGVVNLNDESVMGNLSGRAMQIRIWSMELLAADMDGYFDKGLQKRLTLIQNVLGTNEMVTINHKRNIPEDLLDMTEAANAMLGQPIPKEDVLRIAYTRDVIPNPGETVAQAELEGTGLDDTQGQTSNQSETIIVDDGDSTGSI